MKKALSICLAIALLLSFAACTAAPVEETPAPTPEAISEPTPSPAPEPTSTTEPTPTSEPELTEGEKMFDVWLVDSKKRKRDVYANLVATKAYYDGELDALIEAGKYTEEDVTILIGSNHVVKNSYYYVTDNIITNDYNVDELTEAELVIAILRGDEVKTSAEALNETYHAFDWLLSEGYSLVSVLPEESRADAYELIDIIDNIRGKDVSKFEEKINSDKLDWRQKWYVIQYVVALPGISPMVIQNGEEIQFVKYIYNTNIAGDFVLELQEIFTERYVNNEGGRVEFFKDR